ncbi:von Willebrand factor type A domain-containing protein [Aliikangiella sp. G2MR2-5]|uniref:vWA domain-containing protein n=1 Tax=Aliikangiella sp. G2MR2-5 TaxID=2788943 RepID=UPI0018AC44BB|nr:von Willebrand factor type A domain-containing protein [Aliikangiella sp. G2MR2-5]
MKICITSLKIATSTLLVIALANCASTSHDSSTVIEEAEETKITITGSRVKRTDIEETVVVEIEPVAPPPSKPAAETLDELLLLVKQNKAKQELTNKERESIFLRERNNQRAQLSDADKDRLFRTIANSAEASGQIFKRYRVNPTIQTEHNPVSTFSMDVDNGSYKLASVMLSQNQLPHPDGIRIEEFVNSMEYHYNQNEQLFSISAEAMPSPFRTGYHILHIGLQTKMLSDEERNPSNLVLVADISGSMASDNKLDLLKNAMTTLVSQLNRNDHIALVVYNDNATVVLNPTKASNKRKIFNAINTLKSGGSTNAEQGLLKGYELAESMFQPGFNNRVILTSDGMANVGSTSPEAILAKISESRNKGIFLTTLGVGKGMYNDHLLEQLANQGNGNYLYIANQIDIQQAFVDELNSQLQTVAKDAKIQVQFNPNIVSNYRLLGYENRHLNKEDFADASKDGGEVGAGHKVTALYEIKLNSKTQPISEEVAKLSIAYKKPQGHKVHFINKNIPLSVVKHTVQSASPDSRLSFAVAAFAEKLRQSYWARVYSYLDIEQLLSTLPITYQRQPQVQILKEQVRIAHKIDSRVDLFEQSHPVSNINYDRVPLLD